MEKVNVRMKMFKVMKIEDIPSMIEELHKMNIGVQELNISHLFERRRPQTVNVLDMHKLVKELVEMNKKLDKISKV